MKKTLRSFNSTLRNNGQGLKRSPLKQRSNKKVIQQRSETTLRKEMLDECGHVCQYCGTNATGNDRNLGKHEIVFRSLVGDPLDKSNCIILCWVKFNENNELVIGCHQLAQLGKITKQELYKIKEGGK